MSTCFVFLSRNEILVEEHPVSTVDRIVVRPIHLEHSVVLHLLRYIIVVVHCAALFQNDISEEVGGMGPCFIEGRFFDTRSKSVCSFSLIPSKTIHKHTLITRRDS